MSERFAQPATQAPAPESRTGLRLAWLRERLLPGGGDIMMLVAYVMILTSLVTFILFDQSQLPAWRFAGAILALSALLVLNIGLQDIECRLGKARVNVVFLLASAALFLLANALGGLSSYFP